MMTQRWIKAAGAAILSTGLTVSATGCSEDVEQAKQAASAAKALAEAMGQAQKTAQAVETAQAKAEDEARAAVPEDATAEQAEQQVGLAKTMAAIQAMQKSGGGPVVNWRQLAPHLPEEFEGFTAKSELEGSTNSTGGMQMTEVKRRYTKGDKKLSLKIADTTMAGMMRAPFAMAAMINEDSTRGYKKGKTIEGHSAIVEWESKRKRSRATALVGERFLISVQVDGTQTEDEAEHLLTELALSDIAKLKAEQPQ